MTRTSKDIINNNHTLQYCNIYQLLLCYCDLCSISKFIIYYNMRFDKENSTYTFYVHNMQLSNKSGSLNNVASLTNYLF